MGKEMTLDEALLKIVELEEKVENQNTIIDTLNNEKVNNTKEIDKLQKSNMELFLKVTSKEVPQEGSSDDEDQEELSKMEKLLSEWE